MCHSIIIANNGIILKYADIPIRAIIKAAFRCFAKTYEIINGKIEYKKKNITAFLDVNTITDKEYSEFGVIAEYPTEKAFYPSPKINFLAGVSADFWR